MSIGVGTLCDPWAQDILQVTFQSTFLKNDAALQSAASYSIEPLDGGVPVSVLRVQTGNENNTPHVWLVTTPPEIGKVYKVTFANLFTVDGTVVSPGACKFIGRSTKEDSIINGRPQMFDMRPQSIYRQLLLAIGREDDLIGGSRNDFFTTPIPSAVPISVDIEPKNVTLSTFAKQAFTATVSGTGNQSVLWYVNDILGGNSTVGTIDGSGNYISPFLVPTPQVVTIKAVSVADPDAFDTTTVTIDDGAVLFRSTTPIPTSGPTAPVGATRVYTLPVFLPLDVSGIRVRAANRGYQVAAAPSAAINFALYTSDGAELPTGPSFADFSLTLPGDGSVVSSALFPVTNGPDGKIVIVYSFPDPNFCSTSHVLLGQYADGTTVVDPVPGVWTGVNPNPNFWFEIEYKTIKRKFIVLGDSISVGYSTGTAVGFNVAAWSVIQSDDNLATDIEGVVQFGSLQNFADDVTYPYLWDELVIDSQTKFVIQLGTNDLAYNDLATMQTALQAIITKIQNLGATEIYAWTVPPQAAFAGTDVTRAAYNAWLIANAGALGLTAVYDAAADSASFGLATIGDPNTLDPSFDSGDGTHPNTAGQSQIMIGWEQLI